MNDDPLLTPDLAAKQLNRTPQTLAGWRTKGFGPAFEKQHGGRIMYRRSEIETWRLNQQRMVRFPELPPAKRMKRLSAEPAEVLEPVDGVDVIFLTGRGARLEGFAVWKPVDLDRLSVSEMLREYVDLVVVERDGTSTTYGVTVSDGLGWSTAPRDWLGFFQGRLVKLPYELVFRL